MVYSICCFGQRRVPRGHVSIRNPLQAPKERSCGISITSPSLGSAKRDRLSSSTSYGMRQSPFGELYGVEVLQVPTAALLRSLQWVSLYRSRSAEPAAHTQSAASVCAWLRRDAIASYVCSASSYIVVIRNFVLPRKSSKFLTLRRFCRHNICIPNAQYYEFSAQQNLWCEILEFWALGDNAFIHSELCGFRTERYEIRLANELLLYAIAPLLHSNSGTFIMQ